MILTSILVRRRTQIGSGCHSRRAIFRSNLNRERRRANHLGSRPGLVGDIAEPFWGPDQVGDVAEPFWDPNQFGDIAEPFLGFRSGWQHFSQRQAACYFL